MHTLQLVLRSIIIASSLLSSCAYSMNKDNEPPLIRLSNNDIAGLLGLYNDNQHVTIKSMLKSNDFFEDYKLFENAEEITTLTQLVRCEAGRSFRLIIPTLQECKTQNPLTHGLTQLLNALLLRYCSQYNFELEDLEACNYILLQGADCNTRGKHGYTPLFKASQNGHYELVQLLLSYGADSSLCNDYGTSPLSAATFKENIEIISLLLQQPNHCINAQNKDGYSVLHQAVINQRPDIVNFLLQNKDINHKLLDNTGKTALNRALMIMNYIMYDDKEARAAEIITAQTIVRRLEKHTMLQEDHRA